MTDAIDTSRSDPGVPADPGVLAIVEKQPLDARLANRDGRWVLTMVRGLPAAPARVWRKLTEPSELAKWSPIVPDRPLTSPGPAFGHEVPSDRGFDVEVLVADPPRELVHRWGGHVLRWTIEPAEHGSVLTLEHTFDEAAERRSYAAGWHIVLAVLEAELRGGAHERVVGERANAYGWPSLAERYEASFGR